jgi:hypothetical protein
VVPCFAVGQHGSDISWLSIRTAACLPKDIDWDDTPWSGWS